RIGEPSRFKNAAKANNWKKAITGHPSRAAGPSRNFGARLAARGPAASSDVGGGLARNSIGMLTQDISSAAANAVNGAEGMKNAVGIDAKSSNNTMAGNAGTTTNAIGLAVPLRTNVPKTNSGQHSDIASSETTANAVINGTAMVRPAFATTTIGG